MSGKKIGLDFGTTNSTVSYLEGNRLKAFQYGGPSGKDYIPSFIAYPEDDDDTLIGTEARALTEFTQGMESYGNFKMQLPMPKSEFPYYFKADRTPVSVTVDYLRELLLSTSNDYSFKSEQGAIDGIVVSVPEIWHHDVNNIGRERLQRLISDELGLGEQLIQLVSEPVAAAAYYAWQNQQMAEKDELFLGNLLVCDMGGGTFDVSLCKISSAERIDVLYFDGEGYQGLECAGVAFDRRCVKTAYNKKHGVLVEESSSKFKALLHSFEEIKIASHTRSTKLIKKYLDDPIESRNKVVYQFGDSYQITAHEINEAFLSIADGIQRVIHRIQDWLKAHNEHFDRLLFVGGFCQFVLVQKTIFDALDIHSDDERYDQQLNIASRTYAISFGACIIANGLISPSEKFMHTMGIEVLNPKRPATAGFYASVNSNIDFSIIDGDKYIAELENAIFPDQEFTAGYSQFPLMIWAVPYQSESRVAVQEYIELPNHSIQAKYKVGMRVNRSLIAYLIIKELESGQSIEYELGNILSKRETDKK